MLEKKAKAKNYNSDVKNCIHYVQYSTTSQNSNPIKLETFLEDRVSPKLQLLPSQKVNLDSTLFYFVIFLYFVSIKNLGGALF
jgi:hypothetical protein